MYRARRKRVDTSESSTEPGSKDPAPDGAPRRGLRRWAMDTRPLRRPAYRRLWSDQRRGRVDGAQRRRPRR
ncbi:hypothetical protein B5181_33585, partial [Streptomyces sp. 4F]